MVPVAYHDGVAVQVCDLATDHDWVSAKLLLQYWPYCQMGILLDEKMWLVFCVNGIVESVGWNYSHTQHIECVDIVRGHRPPSVLLF